MEIDTIEEGFFYHIYNRGNNGENIFYEQENYYYFLKLFGKYILPVADVYAYCLLENYFHFLIRIKEENEIRITQLMYSTVNKPKIISASKQLSHFFNAYCQAINKKYARTGSLFEKPFERTRIEDENHLKQVIVDIHTKPFETGFSEDLKNYYWSSYQAIISNSFTKIKRTEVLDLFDDRTNFIFCHNQSKMVLN